ncbi:hypothetical protein HF086_001204 [Spodoptera exigua]|uniref:Transcription termination factor 5, mitochondrial n=1 Tax=Spodoptera exigua TaxID=7107 RepID=A0A922MBR9_SPOEX|nr:hypothetical protein HF086_001204 [Spodoptera exigua]
MRLCIKRLRFLSGGSLHFSHTSQVKRRQYSHGIPFLDFYKTTTGTTISEDHLTVLKKKHPHIMEVTHDSLQCTLQILQKYHTFIRSRTIAWLKKEGLLSEDIQLEQVLLDKFQEWPESSKTLQKFCDTNTSVLTIRMNILEKFLNWKLAVSSEEFRKYCRNYLPLQHKPMSDIQEAIRIAENEIKFDKAGIRRNGFVISADPLHTKLILENVRTLAGMDIRDVLKIEPAILKNNYNSIIQVRNILEMLLLVIHKKKMLNRLTKIETAKKQCFSLNHLVSSSKVFNNYINSFGDKVCGRDIAILITSSLKLPAHNGRGQAARITAVLNQLRRHKYWLHVAMSVIDENIQFLRNKFDHQIIMNNCVILLYPVSEVKYYIETLLCMRSGQEVNDEQNDELNYSNVRYDCLTDAQILSLVLYTIEKKYHFSGDGIWCRQDGLKVESQKN